MKNNVQLFTIEARRRLIMADKKNNDLRVCEKGVLDGEEGAALTDEQLIPVLIARGVDIQKALTTADC